MGSVPPGSRERGDELELIAQVTSDEETLPHSFASGGGGGAPAQRRVTKELDAARRRLVNARHEEARDAVLYLKWILTALGAR